MILAATVPLERHLGGLNALVLVLLLLAVTPIPRRREVRWWTVVAVSVIALVVGFALLVIGAVEISASHPSDAFADLPMPSWRDNPHARQWVALYVLWASAGILVCLTSRLLFTRGVSRAWSAVTGACAVLCVVGVFLIRHSG